MPAEAAFDELQATLDKSGVESALARLAEQLRADGKLHELFDVRLMQGRRVLGLPVASNASLDELPEPAREKMEQAYLDACREVGGLLLDAGRLREAWMYLRPAGDKQLVAARLGELAAAQAVNPDESPHNVQHLIEIALHEGVAPKIGFQLVLANYGVCNAISMYDAEMHHRPKTDRQQVAALLLHHVHGDLVRNLRGEIQRKQGAAPAESSIGELVAERAWLFENNDYHIDTSHLAAVVRFAMVLEDPAELALAADLTEYGRRLSAQYQYPGPEPFTDLYRNHRWYFRALLGLDVEEALAHFRDRAESLAGAENGVWPAEVYVNLLSRLDRRAEALAAAAELLPPGTTTLGFAPSIFQLASLAGDFGKVMQVCRRRGDLLGFGTALVAAHG